MTPAGAAGAYRAAVSHAVVALFDPDLEGEVHAFWRTLADHHDLDGMAPVPFPHFSWLVFHEFDDTLLPALRSRARTLPALPVRSDGWMLFTGPPPTFPAIVRHVVMSPALLDVRRQVLEACLPHVHRLAKFMADDQWTPHITCATRGTTPAQAAAVLGELAATTPGPWLGRATRLALIENPVGDDHRLRVVAAVASG